MALLDHGRGADSGRRSHEKLPPDSPMASKVLQIDSACEGHPDPDAVRALATTSLGLVNDEVRQKACMYRICQAAGRSDEVA